MDSRQASENRKETIKQLLFKYVLVLRWFQKKKKRDDEDQLCGEREVRVVRFALGVLEQPRADLVGVGDPAFVDAVLKECHCIHFLLTDGGKLSLLHGYCKLGVHQHGGVHLVEVVADGVLQFGGRGFDQSHRRGHCGSTGLRST